MNRFLRWSYSWLKKTVNYIKRKWNSSNAITLAALVFSIVQNCVNDKRYSTNEVENNKELARIHDRDSVQSYHDSIRTDLLFNEYHVQLAENIKDSKRDSTQLTLFGSQILSLDESVQLQNEALKIQFKTLTTQNQLFENQRLASKAYLSSKLLLDTMDFDGYNVSINPVVNLTNDGKVDAQNLVYSYCLIIVDKWNSLSESCLQSNDFRISIPVKVGKDEKVTLNLYHRIKVKLDSTEYYNREAVFEAYRNKEYEYIRDNVIDVTKMTDSDYKAHQTKKRKEEDVLYKKYPLNRYDYYCITRVSYGDRFQKDETYTASKIYYRTENWTRNKLKIYTSPVNIDDLQFLKKCIYKSKYDYLKLVDIIKNSSAKDKNYISY